MTRIMDTEYPTILPCGCILNRCGSLFHQCETAHTLLCASLEAQKAGDISLSHELAAEYDEHIDQAEKQGGVK